MFTETGFLLCGLHAELILHVLLNTTRQRLNELKLKKKKKNDFHTYVKPRLNSYITLNAQLASVSSHDAQASKQML